MSEAAVVTGGASGIGKAIAFKLASRGIKVLVADVAVELGEKTVSELKSVFHVEAAFLKVDTSCEEDVKQMVATVVQKWSRLDWACNCAGITEVLEPDEDNYSVEQFNRYPLL